MNVRIRYAAAGAGDATNRLCERMNREGAIEALGEDEAPLTGRRRLMQISDDLFLGTKGHVVRVRKRDGKEVWRTKLKGSNLVVVVVEPDGIFA